MVRFVEAGDPAIPGALSVGAFKGAITNLANDAYHSKKAYWSSSDLKFITDSSPAHFHHEYFRKDEKGNTIRKERESKWSNEKDLGSLTHCLILEPQNFEKDFFLMPDLNTRTNEGKARREELLTNNPGKLPITDEMLIHANGMRSSVQANDEVMKLLEPGRKEASYFWTCKYSNLNFKAKLDQSSSIHFCELKTSYTAHPDHFPRIAYNLNYDLSLYHYREALRNVMGIEVPAYMIVVEPEPPYVCQPYKVGDGMWNTGHEKWLDAIVKLGTGMQLGKWPAYVPSIMGIPEINPPPWAIHKLMKDETT